MKTLTYTLRIEPAEEGGYNVFVPTLPGCQTQGRSYGEAIAHAREAIQAYLDSLAKDGLPLPKEPEPREPIKVSVQVEAPLAAP